MKRKKLIGCPERPAMPTTTTLAEAPIAVALPPRHEPSASDHHTGCRTGACSVESGRLLGSPAPSWRTTFAMSSTSGLIVATYGMLSTTAESPADAHSSVKAVVFMLSGDGSV